jgi:hypothetical protein
MLNLIGQFDYMNKEEISTFIEYVKCIKFYLNRSAKWRRMYVRGSTETYRGKVEFGCADYFHVDREKPGWNSDKCCISYKKVISLPVEEMPAGLCYEVSNFVYFFILLHFHSFFFLY